LKTKISIILLFISLSLLVIYGADVISSKIASNDGKSGFLQLNDAIRGGVFGGGAVILSIIAFVISLKEKSTLVSVLLFINGGLIIAGMIGLAVQGMVQEGASNNSTLLGTTGLGILLIALGIAKIIITRKK